MPASQLADVFPKIELLSLPYQFANDDHFWWYVTSARGKALTQGLVRRDLRLLGYLDISAYGFASQPAPLATLDDFHGSKLRVLGTPIAAAMVDALGGAGIPLAFSEVYPALQTGVIDGAEVTPQAMVSQRFYEVAPYCTDDEHIRLANLLLASQAVFAERPRKQRQAIKRAGELTQAYARGTRDTIEHRSLQDVEDLGGGGDAGARALRGRGRRPGALGSDLRDEIEYIRDHAPSP